MDEQLTPFEKAELNTTIHGARMILCAKVQKLTETLIEVEKLRALPEGHPMRDPEVLAIAEAEEKEACKQLATLAMLWEKTDGVSA